MHANISGQLVSTTIVLRVGYLDFYTTTMQTNNITTIVLSGKVMLVGKKSLDSTTHCIHTSVAKFTVPLPIHSYIHVHVYRQTQFD